MRFLLPAVFSLSMGLAAPALADISVSGDARDLTVDIAGETLTHVLDQIGTKTGLRIDYEGDDDPVVNGSFHGSVETVLGDIMRNMSFMMTALDGSDPGLLVVLYSAVPAPEGVPGIPGSAAFDPSAGIADPAFTGLPGGPGSSDANNAITGPPN